MRRTTYSLDEQFEKMYANSMYSKGDDNRTDIKKMKAMVRSAIGYTLTKRQRECLTMYYFDHLKMREIAQKTGLNKSTVSRHISAASKNLRKLNAFVE